MYTVDSAIYAEARMTEGQFRALVGSICGRRISRSWFYELRGELGIDSGDFTSEGARVMAFYAQLRRRRVSPSDAKQQTIKFTRENNL